MNSSAFSHPCIIHTESGDHQLRLALADGFFSRLRGLMLAPPLEPGQGLLLARCTSIHSCFMLQIVDVIYLDRDGIVTRCESALKPWRVSSSRAAGMVGKPSMCAMHVLELAVGSIARFGIAVGNRLQIGAALRASGRPVQNTQTVSSGTPQAKRQMGSAMIEFIVVGPIITLMGLASIQYGLLFFVKNQYNHAAFMAARAGTTGNANMRIMQDAYAQALVPIHGGGTNGTELANSLQKAKKDLAVNARIEMLNPTRESFADFNDPALQAALGLGSKRVIPHGGLEHKNPAIVAIGSGQNIQDANLLKLRIVHGYKPQVPVIGAMYVRYLKWLDTGTSSVNTETLKLGLIPVVSHVTLHMQSDAIEDSTMSAPGVGNGGVATNPGNPPVTTSRPPACASSLCSNDAGNPASTDSTGSTGAATTGGVTDPGDGVAGGICLQASQASS